MVVTLHVWFVTGSQFYVKARLCVEVRIDKRAGDKMTEREVVLLGSIGLLLVKQQSINYMEQSLVGIIK